ncbi:MAG: hypothetical protein R3E32_25005 [Chitinophagales bacterium]
MKKLERNEDNSKLFKLKDDDIKIESLLDESSMLKIKGGFAGLADPNVTEVDPEE